MPCRIREDGIQQTSSRGPVDCGSLETRVVTPRHHSPFFGNMMGRAPRPLGTRRPASSLILNDPCLIGLY